MSLRSCQQPSIIRELQQELFPLMTWFTQEHSLSQGAIWSPKVDIKEEKNEFVVYADIPGVDPKNIEIEMEGKTLTLKGEKQCIKEEKDKDNYYRVERTFGKFYRQFTLPDTVDGSKISARTKQGVLAIHIPKAENVSLQRKIKVEDGDIV